MKKLKNKLIKWLGGYTQEELSCTHKSGKYNTYFQLKVLADSLYGQDTETWCKIMYQEIVDGYNKNKLVLPNATRRNS